MYRGYDEIQGLLYLGLAHSSHHDEAVQIRQHRTPSPCNDRNQHLVPYAQP